MTSSRHVDGFSTLIFSSVDRIGRERGYVRGSDLESIHADLADKHDKSIALDRAFRSVFSLFPSAFVISLMLI
jgi:hypothetical protein